MSPLDARRRHAKGMLLAAAGIVVISPDGLLVRLVRDAGTWNVLFWRSLYFGLALGGVLVWRHRWRLPAVVARMGWAGLASALLLAVANGTFVLALMHTTVAETLVLMATMPFFSALLGRLLIGEAVRRRTWIAIGAAFAGVLVIFGGALGHGSAAGNLFALAAAAAHGLNLVTMRRAGDHERTPALCAGGLLTALVVVPLADPGAVTGAQHAILGLLGGLVLPLALSLFFEGTRYLPAAEVALFSLLETVLGPIWVWLGVGEVPRPSALLGGALVAAAVAGHALAALTAPAGPATAGARGAPAARDRRGLPGP